ncbi:MAG: hypothetical protein ACI88A_001817 [Paraglaciecola sp.]|jgi:hypothetical protein
MTAIILTLAGVSITLLMLAEWRAKHARAIQQRQLNLHILSKFHGLLALLQKHRGISAALLRGKNNALPSLGKLRSQINAQITFLNKQAEIKNMDRWLAFIDHWRRFQQNGHLVSVTNSFEQHTNMIANLLLLLENITDFEKFNRKNFRKLDNLSLLWRELPILIESMGQIRAIGVGVITARICCQADKLKLDTLHKEIIQRSRIVFLHFRENSNQSSRQHNLLQQASESTARLTHTAVHQLIDAKQISLDIESYYALASQAMETSGFLLDYEMEQVTNALALS